MISRLLMVNKTLERIQRYYYFPSITKKVRSYTNDCESCNVSNSSNRLIKPKLSDQHVIEQPLQRVYIDLMRPYPRSSKVKTYVLIVLDHFTKFVLFKALSNASIGLISEYLRDNGFYTYGIAEVILCDNGPQFRSSEY